jgi:hypothetical protein
MTPVEPVTSAVMVMTMVVFSGIDPSEENTSVPGASIIRRCPVHHMAETLANERNGVK